MFCMKLISVTGSNFRSYKTLSWSLPSNGLFLIDGENLDTGRNNMTGKSTIIDFFAWGLYGWLPKWGSPKGGPADGVIMRGESICSVTVTVENEGKTYTITRQRPLKLTIDINGERIEGKASDLDSRIPDMIGMTADQFLTSVYISQDRKKSFFTMSETERTQLLSQVSRVENINRGMETAKLQKQTAETSIDRQRAFQEGLKFQLTKLPETIQENANDVVAKEAALSAGVEKLSEVCESNRASSIVADQSYDAEIQVINQEFDQKYAEMSMVLRESEAELSLKEMQLTQAPRVEIEYTQTIEEIKRELALATKSNHDGLLQNAKNAQARTALSNIADAIESSHNGTCDHCNQDLPSHMREKHINDLLVSVPRWENMIKDVPATVDTADIQAQLNDALQAYAKRKADLESGPARLQLEVNFLQRGIVQQKHSMMALVNSKGSAIKDSTMRLSVKIRELDHERTMLEHSVNSLQKQLESAKIHLDQVKNQEAQIQAEIDTNKVRIFTLQKELDQALDLIDLFKGFRQVCFEGLIARISDRAGDLLSLMTDGVYSTRIDQVGETSLGEMKLILKPMITKGGHDVPNDDLSGGARRTVMLAYDVAVAEAVGNSNVLFLDEALDGLDTIGKSEALRLLEEVSRTRAVLVIDHSSEIRAEFSSIIKITYKNGISSLEAPDGAA